MTTVRIIRTKQQILKEKEEREKEIERLKKRIMEIEEKLTVDFILRAPQHIVEKEYEKQRDMMNRLKSLLKR